MLPKTKSNLIFLAVKTKKLHQVSRLLLCPLIHVIIIRQWSQSPSRNNSMQSDRNMVKMHIWWEMLGSTIWLMSEMLQKQVYIFFWYKVSIIAIDFTCYCKNTCALRYSDQLLSITVADPGFPIGGRGLRKGRRLPRQLRFENFVCENERIWTLGGACAGNAP